MRPIPLLRNWQLSERVNPEKCHNVGLAHAGLRTPDHTAASPGCGALAAANMLQHVYVDGATAKGECMIKHKPATVAGHALSAESNMLNWTVSKCRHVYTYAGKRDYQQDRHIAIPNFKPNHGGDGQVSCCLVGVFDGHKSEQAAELAAAKMPGIIAARKLSHAA